jgi:putative hemolysin
LFKLIVIVVSLLLSFYFAGTETAFISVNRVRVEVWRRQKHWVAEQIAKLLRKPERFIYTTLVGNNIANISFASFATVYLHNYMDEKLTWLLITAVTVLVGEIIPKTLFRSLADWIIRKVAPILYVFYYIFLPLIWLIGHISGLVLRLFHHQDKEISDFFSKKDVDILIRKSQSTVNIEKRESEYLRKILHLRRLQVREAMIPRTEIIAVEENASIMELVEQFQKSGFTKIPVFRENLDNVLGVVILKDLFNQPETVKEILREVMFVPETKRCSQLLREFRKMNTTIAIAIDEYGGTAGLVTSEDLIEELVGEIEDEFDLSTTLIRKVGDNTYSVNARIEIDELKDKLGVVLPEGEYDTLAGFILNFFGHIPRRDESFELDDYKFTVSRATRRKVEYVRIILPE